MPLDEQLLRFLDAHRSGTATTVVHFVMALGSNSVLGGATLLALVIVLLRRSYRPAVSIALAVPIATLAAGLLKDVFDRTRPPLALALLHVHGASFPSTEAARTSAAAMALLLATRWRSPLTRRMAASFLALAAAIVGASMIYLGAHWLSDVLAGWLLGSAIGAAVAVRCRAAGRQPPAPAVGCDMSRLSPDVGNMPAR